MSKSNPPTQNHNNWSKIIGLLILGIVSSLSLSLGGIVLQGQSQTTPNNEESVNSPLRQQRQTFDPSEEVDSPRRSGGDIVDTLSREREFTTFFSALKIANLSDTLKQQPFVTVLAPTNTAFRANASFYAQLLQPQNYDRLVTVLKYHLVLGKITSDTLQSEVKTLAGTPLKIEATATGVILNGSARTIQPSIITQNGIIVRVDQVLIPPNLP